ncbi:MAG TPA: hypothetical protein IAA98_13515 [Candidatus Avipropionibacterium avicola]|uniref:Uncharacterized protein n=1 Tax=Candidatus Avipropionibacterium avicola TaxID=2840701 RepID=A0A9D1GZV0_9ACTN|nr:hypothetical protein [Candidatus Avipropionibacterium avicola]
MANRYDGRPMLRLLDSYVLDRLGLLDATTARGLAAQAPTLAQALGVGATDWPSIVEQTMDLPPEFSGAVVEAWAQFREAQQSRGITPDPIEFTHLTTDHLIGDR